jgi:hypothetical protein
LATVLVIACSVARPASATAETAVVGGDELAVRWPSLIGRTVRLRLTLVQALDVVRFHAKADATDVVLTLAPHKAWRGQRLQCASVLGPETLPHGGRSQVVALLWRPCR